MAKTFKKGDKVRCIKNPSDNKKTGSKSLRGKIGMVQSKDGSSHPLVKFEGWTGGWGEGLCYWYIDGDHLTLVEEKKAGPKFPAGTKVWHSGLSEKRGFGTVFKHDGSDFRPYHVDFKDGTWDWCSEEQLSAYTEVPESNDGLYIVIVEQDGDLKPADVPKTFKKRTLAQHVADDMAKRHGGKFLVFKAVYASTSVVSSEKLD